MPRLCWGDPRRTTHPRCPLCGTECSPKSFAPHTRQCERDCASRSIEALDRAMLRARNTVPRDPGHALMLDLELACLTQELYRCWTVILGEGTPHTGAPGWPDDGMDL